MNRLIRIGSTGVLRVLRFMVSEYENPPLTMEDVLETLSVDAPTFVLRVHGLLRSK